jgi:hypothetical protein
MHGMGVLRSCLIGNQTLVSQGDVEHLGHATTKLSDKATATHALHMCNGNRNGFSGLLCWGQESRSSKPSLECQREEIRKLGSWLNQRENFRRMLGLQHKPTLEAGRN